MRRLLASATLTLLAVAPSICHALGFGEINLQSALNQPLKAEIPLLAVKPVERNQVTVEIASIDTFKRFGIERPAVLDQIDVEIIPGANDTRLRILVNSRVPIQEPFLTFLLEANWPDGRAIREYTVLLDPPVSLPRSAAQPTAQAASAAPVRSTRPLVRPQPVPVTSPSRASPRISTVQPRSAPTPRPVARSAQPAAKPQINNASRYGEKYGPIAPGETLWGIANRTRPAQGVTQNQMMLAIFQTNPQAFDGDVNLILEGATLSIPSAEDIQQIDIYVAKAEIDGQVNRYKSGNAAAEQTGTQNAATRLQLEPASDDLGDQTASIQSAQQDPDQNTDPEVEDASQEAIAAVAASSNDADPQNSPSDDSSSADVASDTASNVATSAASDNDSDDVNLADSDFDTDSISDTQTDSTQASAPDAVATDENTEPVVIGQGSATGSDAASTVSEQATAIVGASRASAPSAELPNTSESVIPESAGAFITPQRLLLLLIGLLAVVAIIMVRNRRRYRAVPADFHLEEEVVADKTEDNSTIATAAVAATGASASVVAAESPDEDDEQAESQVAVESEQDQTINNDAQAGQIASEDSDAVDFAQADLASDTSAVTSEKALFAAPLADTETGENSETEDDVLPDAKSENGGDHDLGWEDWTAKQSQSSDLEDAENVTELPDDQPEPEIAITEPDEIAEDTDGDLEFDLSDFDSTPAQPKSSEAMSGNAIMASGPDQSDNEDALDFELSDLELSDDSASPDKPLPDSNVAVQPNAGANELRLEDIDDDAPLNDAVQTTNSEGGNGVDEEEVTTKLDLARAYIDMGETDMAASLLEDVQSQGNAEQQQEAKTLLESTG